MSATVMQERFVARVDELRPIAYSAGFRVLGDRSLSEDIAQEALLRSLRRWPEIEPFAQPWISRVATNLAIDECRRNRSTVGDAAATVIVDRAVDDHGAAVADRDELWRAVAALPHRQRMAIILRMVRGLTPDEAARVMGIDRTGVLKHTTRALATLRTQLRSSC